MAYLFKHTPLQSNFHVNLTCLVPPELPATIGSSCRPARRRSRAACGIKEMLEPLPRLPARSSRERRFEYQLAQLEARIHILEGFVTIFDALDELIKIIRASDGKEDAAAEDHEAVQARRDPDRRDPRAQALQAREARDQRDPRGARGEGRRGQAHRGDPEERGQAVDRRSRTSSRRSPRSSARRAAPRPAARARRWSSTPTRSSSTRTRTSSSPRDGWIKRVRELKDPNQTRTREGDEVTHVLPGSTKEKVIFFTNRGSAYVIKINDIAATTGYGDPAQKYFKFGDGERIVAAMTLDPRAMVPPTLLAVSRQGYGLRFASARAHRDHHEGRPALRQARARATRSSAWSRATTATSSSPPRATATCCTARPTRSRSSRGRAAASP